MCSGQVCVIDFLTCVRLFICYQSWLEYLEHMLWAQLRFTHSRLPFYVQAFLWDQLQELLNASQPLTHSLLLYLFLLYAYTHYPMILSNCTLHTHVTFSGNTHVCANDSRLILVNTLISSWYGSWQYLNTDGLVPSLQCMVWAK